MNSQRNYDTKGAIEITIGLSVLFSLVGAIYIVSQTGFQGLLRELSQANTYFYLAFMLAYFGFYSFTNEFLKWKWNFGISIYLWGALTLTAMLLLARLA